MENKKEEQWGNIELPGLSDEVLLTKNWNKVSAARQNSKKALEVIAADYDNYRKKYLEAMERYKTDETWRKNQKEAADRFRNDSEHKKKQSDLMKKLQEDPEFNKKRVKGLKKAYKKPEVLAKMKVRHQSQPKRIQTPDGIFNSRKEAAAYYGVHSTQMNYRMGKYPDQYYYIDQDDNKIPSGYYKKK